MITIEGIDTKSGGCSSVTVDASDNYATGDLLVLIFGTEDRTGGDPGAQGSLPSGFTEIVIEGDSNWGWCRAAYKIGTALEGSNYTVSNLDLNVCVTLLTIRGHDADSPIGSDYDTCPRGNSAIPSITPDADGSLVIQTWASLRATLYHSNYANATNPLTWTEQSDFLGNRDVGWCPRADGIGCAVATALQLAAGATGNITASINTYYDVGIAFSINPGAEASRTSIARFIGVAPGNTGKWVSVTPAATQSLIGVE